MTVHEQFENADLHWTRRQREVLNLLAHRKTNGEIAVSLGISLDGAKWHVSEVMSKLGVDSRDEAADYWRRQMGLRPRLARLVRALVPAAWVKFAALGSVVAAGAIVAALVVLAGAGSHGNGAAPVASPTAAITAELTSGPATGETFDGIQARWFGIGDPEPMPPNLAMIIERGCWGCDGPTSGYDLVTTDSAGNQTIRPISANWPEQGALLSSSWLRGTTEAYATFVASGACLGIGTPTPSTVILAHSEDRGSTWTTMATIEGCSSVVGMDGDRAVVAEYSGEPGAQQQRLVLYPGGEEIEGPAGTIAFGDGSCGIFFVSADHKTFYDLAGNVIWRSAKMVPDPLTSNPRFIRSFQSGATSIVYWASLSAPETASAGESPKQYWATLVDGKLTEVARIGGGSPSSHLPPGSLVEVNTIGAELDGGRFVGTVSVPSGPAIGGEYIPTGQMPALIDFARGTILPLTVYGPVGSDGNRQRNLVIAAWSTGPQSTR